MGSEKTEDVLEFWASAIDAFLCDFADSTENLSSGDRMSAAKAAMRLAQVGACMATYFKGVVQGYVSNRTEIDTVNEVGQVVLKMCDKHLRDITNKYSDPDEGPETPKVGALPPVPDRNLN